MVSCMGKKEKESDYAVYNIPPKSSFSVDCSETLNPCLYKILPYL